MTTRIVDTSLARGLRHQISRVHHAALSRGDLISPPGGSKPKSWRGVCRAFINEHFLTFGREYVHVVESRKNILCFIDCAGS